MVRDPSDGSVLFTTVLGSKRNKGRTRDDRKAVEAWEYNVRDENIYYRGLYPRCACDRKFGYYYWKLEATAILLRSWTTYVIPEVDLELTCRQVSPFLPGDYDDSCLPVVLFEWSAKSLSSKGGTRDLSVTLALSFRDGWGKRERLAPQSQDTEQGLCGRLIHQEFRFSTTGNSISPERS